jgi:DNA-binding XRE family transcriptional regulator
MGDWGLESIGDTAERLRLTRPALGFKSASELAEAVGITRQGWHLYEKARARISLEMAVRLCEQFELTLDWIYRGETSGLPILLVDEIAAVKARQMGLPHPDGEIIDLHSVNEVVDALGGTTKSARLLECSLQVVTNWRTTDRIAAKYYLILTNELNHLGYRAPASLWGIEDPDSESPDDQEPGGIAPL